MRSERNLMSGNITSLLGDVITSIVSSVECNFDKEVVIQRVFRMWFCLKIRILVTIRSIIG